MSRLAGDMKGFVVLGVYRSTVKKQNKVKTLLWSFVYLVRPLVENLPVPVTEDMNMRQIRTKLCLGGRAVSRTGSSLWSPKQLL